jgi:hypothetical protein
MSFVIRCWDADPAGQYLRDWDLDANGGRGTSVWVPEIHKAAPFISLASAMEAWRAQCTSVPLRPDGKPNRPLTMYTVEIAAGGGAYQAVPHDRGADEWYVAEILHGIPYPHDGGGFLAKQIAMMLADVLNRDYLQELDHFERMQNGG